MVGGTLLGAAHPRVAYSQVHGSGHPDRRLTGPALCPLEPEIRFEAAPGIQTQADWKDLGTWPLGDEMVELHAMVAALGLSRRPAIRMATAKTREVSFERLVRCLDDLGGVTREILTDCETVF